MTVITWLIAIAMLALCPQFHCVADRRDIDGDRYVEICGWIFQRPETSACLEVGQ